MAGERDPHVEAMKALRERCRQVYQEMGRNAMLRQGDPVDALFTFAKDLIDERSYVIGFNDGWEEREARHD